MLQLTGVAKRYGAVVALRDASLRVERGELHALLGANGSGKSTIIKILAGVVPGDRGEMSWEGRPVRLQGPWQSRRLGIAVAFQDLSLVPTLTIHENLWLSLEAVGTAKAASRAAEGYRTLGPLVGLDAPPSTLVRQLPISHRYLLEIVKALLSEPRLLILDESTAALEREQVAAVFRLLRDGNRERGMSVLFVSHRLDEVTALCRVATVVRDGVTVARVDLADCPRSELIRLLVGEEGARELEGAREGVRMAPRGEAALVAEGLYVPPRVRGVSLALRSGEILGIGGLQGQGQRELLRAVAWLDPPASGRLLWQGRDVAAWSAWRRSVCFVSGDRTTEGVFATRPVLENLYAQEFAREGISHVALTSRYLGEARGILRQVRVAADPASPIQFLSGGNQQKVVLGRLLTRRPSLVVLDDPTIGVDVHARHEIHAIVRSLARDGCGVLVYSSDDEELLSLCDRILVLFEGRVVAELEGDTMTAERLMRATLGQ